MINLFFTCGKDRKILIYSLNSILSKDEYIYNTINCNHLSDIYYISSYNNYIISGSFDKTVKLFFINEDYKKVKNKIILNGHFSNVKICGYSSVHNFLFTIGLDNIINVLQIN